MHGHSIVCVPGAAQHELLQSDALQNRDRPGLWCTTRAFSGAAELKLSACTRAAPNPGHEFLPSHPPPDAPAADALVGTIAEAGIELHVIIDPHRRVEREPIG